MSERYKRIVDVSISPNERVHEYLIAERDGTLTSTPHRELLGIDISRLADRDARPMDEKTRELYDAVKALDKRIISVSIEAQKLTVDGPEKLIGDYYYADWPEGLYLDFKIVHCLSKFLGWEELPLLRVRNKSHRECEIAMNDNVIEAIRLGAAPPEGWTYTSSWD